MHSWGLWPEHTEPWSCAHTDKGASRNSFAQKQQRRLWFCPLESGSELFAAIWTLDSRVACPSNWSVNMSVPALLWQLDQASSDVVLSTVEPSFFPLLLLTCSLSPSGQTLWKQWRERRKTHSALFPNKYLTAKLDLSDSYGQYVANSTLKICFYRKKWLTLHEFSLISELRERII